MMNSSSYELLPGHLLLSHLRQIYEKKVVLTLHEVCKQNIEKSSSIIKEVLDKPGAVYGINTGFGALVSVKIDKHQLLELQRRLVLSHAAGTGDYLPDSILRLILVLKINSLVCGYSGVGWPIIETLVRLYNAEVYPCIPAKGSVGASGDLAPLAHLGTVLIGEGQVRFQNEILSAKQGLALAGLQPLALQPKEGLALLNGTQVSTALALAGLFNAENVFAAAVVAGSLSVDAALASDTPFDQRIHQIRGHYGQQHIAAVYRDLLAESSIRQNHKHCNKVQDPYSLRCQPQVMGAILEYIRFVANILLVEANGVTDNPLVFASEKEILSGGNFHAEPVALAADTLALGIAEMGALSERRIALLIDSHFSGLPAFLVNEPGINSGFMIAQVTAAALASENKSLAHPASVDSIPTSANQEDHVSMATYAARRLLEMADNSATIVAIELLAACQGLDFRKPLTTSAKLQIVYQIIRKEVPFYDQDRFMAPEIEAIKQLVKQGEFNDFIPSGLVASL